MEKYRRKKKKHLTKILVLVTIIVSLFIVLPAYSYMRQNLFLKGNTSIVTATEDDTCSANVNYEISSWSNNNQNYYRIVFILTNTSNKDYNYWDVYFDVPSDSTIAAYSSVEAVIVGSKVKASNVSYNGTVAPDSSVSFEIQIATNENDYTPCNISVNNCYVKQDSDTKLDLKISFAVVGAYGNYTYQYDVTVENLGTNAIDNWNFKIEKPSNTTLSNAWNTNYIVKDDVIEFSNMSYNGTIQPGGTVTFGLIMDTDILNYIPNIVE